MQICRALHVMNPQKTCILDAVLLVCLMSC